MISPGKLKAATASAGSRPTRRRADKSFARRPTAKALTRGVSVLALDYDAQTTTTIRTELGARIKWTIPIHDDASVALRARAAWAHDFRSEQRIDTAFQALPGSTFTVNGAEPARNSLLLSTSAEISFNSGFALAGSFEGEFAENSQTYRGTARLSYRW